jgi:phosphoribosylcarboxyaminoimidazole (NCAIR) mutase
MLKYPDKGEAEMLARAIEDLIVAYRESVVSALRMEEVIHQMTKERS